MRLLRRASLALTLHSNRCSLYNDKHNFYGYLATDTVCTAVDIELIHMTVSSHSNALRR